MMMTEKRLDRVEDKIDKVSEDVVELKNDMKHLMPKIEEHITGDKKIINQIIPLLDKLPTIVEIVEDYRYEQKNKKVKMEKIKNATAKLGLVSLLVGIVVGITKALG